MKKLLFLLALALAPVSCVRSYIEARSENVDTTGTPDHEMIILGNQLEDPYSVVNVTKAVQSLYPAASERIKVEPTDYYVRFLPENQEQFDVLSALGVDMLDHPMDYEILREGDYYIDPEIGENEITWQYSVVKKDFEFPKGICYEILDECYLAENAPTKAPGIDWDAVEREAYRLTGNEGMLLPETKGGASSGTPSGRISIVDPLYDSEPVGVAGVRVSCNSFVKFASAYTDDEGYYQMSKSYSTNIRYRIVFKNKKGFAIGFNLLLVPASVSTLGKNSPEGVSVVVDEDSDSKLFARCAANNAGYDYYCSCNTSGGRMKSPPSNLRIWMFHSLSASSAVMMQQGAIIDNSIIGEFLGDYSSLVKMFLPDVTIGLGGSEFNYAAIYGGVVHEMAHASHFMQVGTSYWDTYIKFILTSFVSSGGVTYGVGTEKNAGYAEIGEMWAYYVETMMYRDRYEGSTSSFGTSFWFYPQIFLYLNERGLDRYKIYAALTPDVTDRTVLQSRLLSLYPEYKNVINQAFLRYL